MKHLKVQFGPTHIGCSIIDADTGERIENVRAITIRAEVDDVTRVTIELVGIEVEGEVTVLDDHFLVEPRGGQNKTTQ